MKGSIEWICPSNIALVKYWGKKNGQIPRNPSLSMTLSESVTRLKLEYEYREGMKPSVEFLFNDVPNPVFGSKVTAYIQKLYPIFPELQHISLKINSFNTFPHSSGIASSASSFGALALSLCSMKEEISGRKMIAEIFFKKASGLARMGSGSASRSVFGGFVLWGITNMIPGSSDEYAIPLPDVNSQFGNLCDSILVVSSREKSVSSTEGHKLMNENPYTEARQTQAAVNLNTLLAALSSGDTNVFISILENEALTLHALMMTSQPSYFLILPATLEILAKVKKFRTDQGLPLGFTLDAGPNVHLIYPRSAEIQVKKWINEELVIYCENRQVIHDFTGKGPERIK